MPVLGKEGRQRRKPTRRRRWSMRADDTMASDPSVHDPGSRHYLAMTLWYLLFIVGAAFGLVLLLLGLFGAFFFGFGIIIVLGLAAAVAIPVGGVTSFMRA